MRKPIKKGDCFLLPFAGKRVDLLVQVKSSDRFSGQWECRTVNGRTTHLNLEATRRVGPVEARRIIGKRKSKIKV